LGFRVEGLWVRVERPARLCPCPAHDPNRTRASLRVEHGVTCRLQGFVLVLAFIRVSGFRFRVSFFVFSVEH